ncbi:MAG TPA: aldolase/citrate lyase family protein [Gammaproteobacteria bacterium]|nr:aldolase/citrate lyase family protein [Gammaproteobacteria bacterium]
MKTILLIAVAIAAAIRAGNCAAQDNAGYEPERLNKVIELLEQGQPVYYAQATGGFTEGVELAQTRADYINYEMEHGAFDIPALREFMRGLAEGGPARSGHRLTPVIVTLPVLGLDEASLRSNHWVVHQVLAAGVHGILLCHARDVDAVRALVELVRYPFAPPAENLGEGLRGAGSQSFAAQIWGVSQNEYLAKADPWPLNPAGEILLGLKIEDAHALEQAELTTAVPGIAFAEWGPSDMEFSLLGLPRPGALQQPEMQAARARVFDATRASGIFMLDICNENNVADRIDEGVMICTGGANAGRAHTERAMPW